ncbi:trypsin-like peptidase domain-containing protein [Pseudoneobacillus sp. C159]
MKNRVILFILAFFVFATVTGGKSVDAKSYSPEQLVRQAEANAKQLTNLISYEKSKKLNVVSSALISRTSTSLKQATVSIKKVKNSSTRKKLETRLKNVQTTYTRTLSYNSAIKIGEGLKGKTKSLLATYAKNPASDSTENTYRTVQTDLKKLTTATTNVYGKTTQNTIAATYKVPADRAIAQTKSAYILKNELDLLNSYLKSGKNDTAFLQVDRFNAQLKSVKANDLLYNSFAKSYESILKSDGVSSDGIPTIILKKIIANEKSVVYLEVYDKDNQPLGQGSGFVVGKSTILTNFHVVQNGYRVVAYDNEGKEIAIRGVVNYDEIRDLAILGTARDLSIPALKIGDDEVLEKGDSIVTIGSPEGLINTISTGIISNLHQFQDELGNILKLIQITAPITFGSSGGALFNSYGEVVGVTSSGFEMGNLNFAVAIGHARNWINLYGNKTASSLTIIPYSSLLIGTTEPEVGVDPVLPGSSEPSVPIGEQAPGAEQQPKVPVSSDKMTLDTNLREVVMHPTKPIIYGLSQGKDLIEINLETKQSRKMTFSLPPERLYFANNELYVTLLKGQHSSYWWEENQAGAFAIVDAEGFKLADIVYIPTDPFDIVADSKYIYISSGSGQHTHLKVYSRETLLETASVSGIYERSFLEMGPEDGQVYAIDTNVSPRDVEVFRFANGKLVSHYDSPYHGDYDLATNLTISPDGKYLVNGSGVLLQVGSTRESDMKYVTKLYTPFEEIAFNLGTNRLYTSSKKGLTVYDYSNLERIKHYELSHEIDFMFIRDNHLIVLYMETTTGTLMPKQVIKKYPLTEQGLLTLQ